MIKLTDNAKKHLTNLKAKHNVNYVRLEVKGGGCAGFEYDWSFIPNEFDKEPTKDDVIVDELLVVDNLYEIYVAGMTLDYKDEIFGSQFVFENPNSKSSCGCGTSFSI
jgi:iron-sulfur cluster insertion protein|tara:strand:- start:5646 stop:5969 length:324 start_codon:yes stop_codon:yes gene_type:complete